MTMSVYKFFSAKNHYLCSRKHSRYIVYVQIYICKHNLHSQNAFNTNIGKLGFQLIKLSTTLPLWYTLWCQCLPWHEKYLLLWKKFRTCSKHTCFKISPAKQLDLNQLLPIEQPIMPCRKSKWTVTISYSHQ